MRLVIAITFKYLIEVFCPAIDILYYTVECFEEFLYIVIFLFLKTSRLLHVNLKQVVTI